MKISKRQHSIEGKGSNTLENNNQEMASLISKKTEMKAKYETAQSEYKKMNIELLKDSGIRPTKDAITVVFKYFLFGVFWIIFSDRILVLLTNDASQLERFQSYKGILYVALTSVLFFHFVRQKMKRNVGIVDRVSKEYLDLQEANLEIIRIKEEVETINRSFSAQRRALENSDQRFFLAVEGANDGLWDYDLVKNTFFFSLQHKCDFFDAYKEADNSLDKFQNFVHPDDREHADKTFEDYINSRDANRVYQSSFRLLNKSGQYRWLLSRGKAIWDQNGKPMRVAGSHTDITEQVELKASLTRYKEISEKLFGETAMLVLLTDMKGQLVELSPYTEKFLGYQAEAFADKGFWEVILQKDRHEEVASIFCGTCENKKIYNLELSVISQAGQKYSVIWNTERLHNDSGEMIGTMAIGVDITERKAMEEKLHRLAYTDLVTGLPNRAMLEETVEHLMGNPHEEFALLYFDIDDFGHINGSLGYEAGDAVLKLVGDVINTEVAQPDQAIHLGSDSFAILMRSSLCMEEINEKARACMNRMKKPWHYQDHEIYLSFCMGISRFPQDADSFATLLQTANAALTSAKELGKDSICTYTSEMREQVDKRIIFGNRLRHALRNQAFFLHYQPLVDLKTQRMYGVEALIRWHDDKNGFIPPNTFIPLAEEIGLIEEIDLWVFENCCRQIRDWRSGRMVIPVMSINLSGKALVSAGLVEKLSGIMVQYAIEGEDIQIEITETAAMEDFDRAIEAIMGLRSLGIKIALDDFGSGYSSLTYLQMLPIDVLKIDRSFISTIQDSAEAAFIYETIVRLAHHLDLKVISEGIETEAQLEFVRSLGSDMAQGYFLEKPVSAEEIVRLFEHVFNWKMNSAIKEEKSS